MKSKTKKLIWTGAVLTAATVLAGVFWVKKFKDYTPAEAVADLRAAIAVRDQTQPVPKFLELRYGSLDKPANRQQAFLGFFNVGHIQGMQMIVARMPAERRQDNINAMANWVAAYRQSMSRQEKEELRDSLKTKDGRRMVQQATSQYLAQDVHYRAATAPVIRELMATLAYVDQP